MSKSKKYYKALKQACFLLNSVTGSKNNKAVYIYQSFRKKNGKSSSRIYKKFGNFDCYLFSKI